MRAKVKTKKVICNITGLLLTLVLLFCMNLAAFAESGTDIAKEAFDVTGSGSKTYTTNYDSLWIHLSASSAGISEFYVTVTGISAGSGNDAAELTTMAYNVPEANAETFASYNYSTPGEKKSIDAKFLTAGETAILYVGKPKADKGNNATMTITIEPKSFEAVSGEVRALGDKEDFSLTMTPGELYWPVNISKPTKMSFEYKTGVSFCDSSKNEFINSVLYLAPGEYFVKTKNDTKNVVQRQIKYTTQQIDKELWDKNTSRKNAKSITIKKKINGVIASDSKKEQKRFFKIKLKKRTKITFTNYEPTADFSFHIWDKKGKTLKFGDGTLGGGGIVKKTGKVKFIFFDKNFSKSTKKKSYYLKRGTYYLELDGEGEYSFKVG
ncbi:hypothetical protein SAMN04487770_102298 [Butyrivibrio sp. ob235]|uniref:hypothetical protein n=1 Tax=Butyrivibrio sp. ob235 TaxID=1761780 RepID=UPI0008CEFDA5|nr:hypothetical protein [Butyrivibrio sp. ob235]SEK70890.1 hypothetical protein SAMN04487770_102298 [Butyrivibrio sp. ob235]